MTANTFPFNLFEIVCGGFECLGVAKEKLTSEEGKLKLELMLNSIKGDGFKEALLLELFRENKSKERIIEEYNITEEAFNMEVAKELRRIRNPKMLKSIKTF